MDPLHHNADAKGADDDEDEWMREFAKVMRPRDPELQASEDALGFETFASYSATDDDEQLKADWREMPLAAKWSFVHLGEEQTVEQTGASVRRRKALQDSWQQSLRHLEAKLQEPDDIPHVKTEPLSDKAVASLNQRMLALSQADKCTDDQLNEAVRDWCDEVAREERVAAKSAAARKARRS